MGNVTDFTDGVNGDIVGGGANPIVDPKLGPLADNGGQPGELTTLPVVEKTWTDFAQGFRCSHTHTF